jgi:hypothetical protein
MMTRMTWKSPSMKSDQMDNSTLVNVSWAFVSATAESPSSPCHEKLKGLVGLLPSRLVKREEGDESYCFLEAGFDRTA